MIKFEKTEVVGWEPAIRGMRNPMNSWDKNDSYECKSYAEEGDCKGCSRYYSCTGAENSGVILGPNDLKLMMKLRNAGPDHRKFMRMIIVYVDITAPLYWWKEFDTYKVGTVANSCSTMHKIHAKEFTLEDFSHEHLLEATDAEWGDIVGRTVLETVIFSLNIYRGLYLETKDKKYWWQMIQLLPSSYNQKRTVMLNYEVLANIYKSRKNHKLDEWKEHKVELIGDCPANMYPSSLINYIGLCDWIKTLPYSELITGEEGE